MSVQYTKTKTAENGYDLNQLQLEINSNAAIAPSCLGISADDTDLTFDFAVALSTAEETELEAMVDDHEKELDELNITELPFSEDTNKLAVQSSAKPMIAGQTTYAVWTGAGDDVATGEIGGGEMLNFELTIGKATAKKDVYFHPDNGRVWINEAYIRFEDGGTGDWICGSIMAPATQLQQVANLDLILDGKWIKYSPGGPGTGTHGFAATPALTPRNFSNDGDWDYDETNGLNPNFAGTGGYNMSTEEEVVHKFVSKIPCRGTTGTYFNMASDDTAELSQPYFIRVQCNNVSNTNWNAQVFLEIYRERTVNP